MLPHKEFTTTRQFLFPLDVVIILLIVIFYLKKIFQIGNYFQFHSSSIFSFLKFDLFSFDCYFFIYLR